jgi:thiol-disulfide isomerase/thioredoxin
MAKPSYSQTNTRANATKPPTNATKDSGQRATRKQIPQARRGSVTRPVKKTPWTLIISGALLVVAVSVVIGVVLANRGNQDRSTIVRPPPVASPVAGATAPDFNVVAKDGSTLTKAQILGKPTMMVFFASWCPHCNNEAPLIKEIAAKNPDVQVVMIGVGDRETPSDIYDFQQKHDLPFPTYQDGGKAAAAYGIASYPTIMAVDKSGIIRDVQTGEKSTTELNSMIGRAKA